MLSKIPIALFVIFVLLVVAGNAAVAGGLVPARTAGEQQTIGEHEEVGPSLSGDELPCKDARKDPSPWLLLGAGLGLAPVAYELGVMWHEGSHAGWVLGFGGHVSEYDPFPSVRGGHVEFGYTVWSGQMTDAQVALIFIAPKLTDLTLLTAYTITNETGNLPKNKWAQLAIDVLALAAVVDLGHDVFQTNQYGDIPEFYRSAHITNTTPMRVLQAGLTLAGAAEVGHGIYKLFAPTRTEPPKKKVPQKTGSGLTAVPYIGGETIGVSGTF